MVCGKQCKRHTSFGNRELDFKFKSFLNNNKNADYFGGNVNLNIFLLSDNVDKFEINVDSLVCFQCIWNWVMNRLIHTIFI